MKQPKIGDVFEIPLSDGRKAFGQYLHQSKMGPLIQVFKLVTREELSVEEIVQSQLLFPPVITGLFAAVKNGFWKIIGNSSPILTNHPLFVSTEWTKNGKATYWYLWDGEREIKIGKELPDEYKTLEFLVVWNPPNVTRRIETGEIPFPYGEIIKNNKFTPLADEKKSTG